MRKIGGFASMPHHYKGLLALDSSEC